MPASSPGWYLIHLEVELGALEVADVHPQEDLGPVLGVDATGTGVDAHDGRSVVVLGEEERLPLELCQRLFDVGELGEDVGDGRGIILLGGQIEQHIGIVERLFEGRNL